MSEQKLPDYASHRAACRAAAVALARQHLLGPETECYCEALGEFMAAALDMIWGAAAVKFAPTTTVPGLDTQDLAKQMQQHAGKIAETAMKAMDDLYLHTLIAAKMAYGGAPTVGEPGGSRAN